MHLLQFEDANMYACVYVRVSMYICIYVERDVVQVKNQNVLDMKSVLDVISKQGLTIYFQISRN